MTRDRHYLTLGEMLRSIQRQKRTYGVRNDAVVAIEWRGRPYRVTGVWGFSDENQDEYEGSGILLVATPARTPE